jgi:predicted  nucleic acid-binding Zn-ribbon protein
LKTVVVAASLIMAAILSASAQQPDPSKLLGPLQAQRDTANNQVVVCTVENADLKERVKQLEAQVAQLSPKKD